MRNFGGTPDRRGERCAGRRHCGNARARRAPRREAYYFISTRQGDHNTSTVAASYRCFEFGGERMNLDAGCHRARYFFWGRCRHDLATRRTFLLIMAKANVEPRNSETRRANDAPLREPREQAF